MGLVGYGISETFPESQVVGAPESNSAARLAFKRRHGFSPFSRHENAPDYAYSGVFGIMAGAPCVAMSPAGRQQGLSDMRGTYYVEQVRQYTRCKTPLIVFEQVPEARLILPGDSKSRLARMSPQDQLVELQPVLRNGWLS